MVKRQGKEQKSAAPSPCTGEWCTNSRGNPLLFPRSQVWDQRPWTRRDIFCSKVAGRCGLIKIREEPGMSPTYTVCTCTIHGEQLQRVPSKHLPSLNILITIIPSELLIFPPLHPFHPRSSSSQNSCCTFAPQGEIHHSRHWEPMEMDVGFHSFLEPQFLFLERQEKATFQSLRLQLPEHTFFKRCISRLSANHLLNKYINMKEEAKFYLCDITANRYFKIHETEFHTKQK